MCIIAAKAAGVKMPDKATIRTMWYGNPDGAGVMYAKDGKVRIDKGFMKLADLEKHLDKLSKELDLTATPVVMHFRITTHGGTRPENTHPFPLTDSIKRLQLTHCSASLGIAHNGVIDITPRSREISDTMEYIASQIAPLSRFCPDFYANPDAMQMIQNAIGSRMVFLTGEGELYTTGNFVESDGILYSNTSYLGRTRYTSYSWGGWSDGVYTGSLKSTGKSKGKSTGKKKSKKGKIVRIEPTRKPLMWLGCADDGAYVTFKDGGIMEGMDFLMDEDGKVYLHDEVQDAAEYIEGASAFTGSGLFLRFNPDYATDELVLPF